MSKPLSKSVRPTQGTKVVMSTRHGGLGASSIKPGEVVEVSRTEDRGLGGYVVYVKDPLLARRGPFGFEWFDQDETPREPIIGTLPHDTQRGYALKARSAKCLSGEHNAVLADAGNGYPVDVSLFRKAATAALSAAATRAAQSPQRRVWTKEARALIHWADAVIDAHIEGLPAYDSKEARSRKVKALEAEVANLKSEVETRNAGGAEVVRALKAAKAEVDVTKRLLETVEESANAEVDRLHAHISELALQRDAAIEKATQAEHERDHWASVSLYVGTKFPETAAVALAYSDGLDDA